MNPTRHTIHRNRVLVTLPAVLSLLSSVALGGVMAPATAAPPAAEQAGPQGAVLEDPGAGAAAAAAAATSDTFSDVPPGSTYFEPVTWMVRSGITTGRGDGTFGVADELTRAEASAFLYRLIDPDFTPPDSTGFPDVTDTRSWSYAPIAWMVEEQIVSGYADGTFKPSRSITRGELAKILFGVADPDYEAPSEESFPDVSPQSAYHPAISWLKSINASYGYRDGTFRPSRPIARGEAAQLLRTVAGELGFDISVVPASFTVTGSGSGHGVGMSQFGARALAAGGKSAAQILDYYYSPAKATWSTSRAADEIKVHVLSAEATTITPTGIEGQGQVRVRAGADLLATAGPVRLAEDRGAVVVTMPDGTRRRQASLVLEWTGTRSWAGPATTVRVPGADGAGAPLDLRHGRLVVTVVGGRLNVVTELRMADEYLYGLAEVPSSWPQAALQAQAVAGRAYAMANMGSLKAECGCHVWDEVRSQKFTGWAKESEGDGRWGDRWKAAVDSTLSRNGSGVPASTLGLWYNGSVADATYYSSSGGHTRWAEDVWGSPVPWLTGRPDPYSVSDAAYNPNRVWTATLSQATMARVFGLPNVRSVTFTVDRSEAARYVTATASDGTTSRITGNQFRSRAGLKSAWISSLRSG
ncbi:S-layer homology domain-containing protein [Citricoccus sp. SGAir0253]|uniref:S-layer homology domain-containing protein n=1 Tax=Citricoccus sp. SGAir0253 TaxID=2567881 RepID=UPI00143D4E05|nr:S-layer homology domain-containing protein [Citricoccus sp. SGAir0253]